MEVREMYISILIRSRTVFTRSKSATQIVRHRKSTRSAAAFSSGVISVTCFRTLLLLCDNVMPNIESASCDYTLIVSDRIVQLVAKDAQELIHL